MKRALVSLLLWCGCQSRPAAPPKPPPQLSDAQRRQAEADLAAARARGDEEDAARRRAVMTARHDPTGAARCPVGAHDLLGDYDLHSTMRNALTVKALGLTELFLDGKSPTCAGPARQEIDRLLEPWEKRLTGGLWSTETPESFLAQARNASPPPYTLSLVVDELSVPRSAGEHEFVGGVLRGRLYLWSHAEHRNICAAPLAGESSESVTATGMVGIPASSLLEGALLGDLLVPAIATAAERLQTLPPASPVRRPRD